jgi:hypothetical protein
MKVFKEGMIPSGIKPRDPLRGGASNKVESKVNHLNRETQQREINKLRELRRKGH